MNVSIFCDGACSGNPGPGGWGAVLQAQVDGELYEKEFSGPVEGTTTNNRAEFSAALEALKVIKVPCNVVLHTDSKLLAGYLSGTFMRKNAQLIALASEIDEELQRVDAELIVKKVPRNSNGPMTRADELAKGAVVK